MYVYIIALLNGCRMELDCETQFHQLHIIMYLLFTFTHSFFNNCNENLICIFQHDKCYSGEQNGGVSAF
jgi:hypothetical protein